MKLSGFILVPVFAQNEETTLAWTTTTIEPTTQLATTEAINLAPRALPVQENVELPNKDIFIVYSDLDFSASIPDQVFTEIAKQLDIQIFTRSDLSTQIAYNITIQILLQALESLDEATLKQLEAAMAAANISARVLTRNTGVRNCPQGTFENIQSVFKSFFRLASSRRRTECISLHPN